MMGTLLSPSADFLPRNVHVPAGVQYLWPSVCMYIE